MRLHLVFPGVCGDQGGDDPPIAGDVGTHNGTSFQCPESTGLPIISLETLATFVVGASCEEDMISRHRQWSGTLGFHLQRLTMESRLLCVMVHTMSSSFFSPPPLLCPRGIPLSVRRSSASISSTSPFSKSTSLCDDECWPLLSS
jgi:hypothetical protein